MRINTNMAALNAWRSMTTNANNVQKSLEKLSSGLRINRAADDAAGLAVSEKMGAQIRGTNMAVRNAQDGISLVQTAEGALTETHSILQRMRELSVQASTGTLNTSDTSAVQKEIDSLIDEVDRIASSTKFNDRNLLTGTTTGALGASLTSGAGIGKVDASAAKAGTFQINTTAVAGGKSDVTMSYTDANGVVTTQTITATVPTGANTTDINFDKVGIKLTVNSGLGSSAISASTAAEQFTVATGAATATDVQVGANTGNAERIQISIGDMSTTGLGIRNLKSDNAPTMVSATQQTARDAVDAIDKAIKSVSDTRAELGATQNRLEHTVSNLQTVSENLTAAQSRIRDVDMASEMANFTKNNILQQASQAMLAQANQSTQGILSLLR